MKSFRAQPLYFPILIVVLVFTAVNCFADTDAMQQATQLELSGKFKEAANSLMKALDSKTLTKSERKKLEFERDRLERIKKDYPYTAEELFNELKGSVKNLHPGRIQRWVKESRFDTREIDGERRFMTSSVSNLFFGYPRIKSAPHATKGNRGT